MTDEERAIAAKSWDSRSPLERLLSLTDQERMGDAAIVKLEKALDRRRARPYVPGHGE